MDNGRKRYGEGSTQTSGKYGLTGITQCINIKYFLLTT